MLPLGRFRGVPIYFAPSWLLIAGLLTVYYAPIVEDVVLGVSSGAAYALAAVFAVLFAFCVLAHELGHTAVSLALGHPVTRIVIFLLGGVSEIETEPRRPRDEFLISAAGPAVSAGLAGLAALGYELVAADSRPGVLFGLLFWSNLVVVVFNVLPGLPLDGGRMLRAAVWGAVGTKLAATRIAAWAGRGVAVLIAVGGLLVDRTSYGLTAGLFALGMAGYLWFGATQSLRLGELMERLPHVQLQALLRPGIMLPTGTSVAEALRRAWTGQARGLLVTDSADRPRAIVDEARIGAVPPERRPWTPVDAVARPLDAGLVLPVGLSGEDLLARVRSHPAPEYLVVHADGSPAGILATADLVAVLKGNA